jgi:phosphatidylglycerol lysyltransferase
MAPLSGVERRAAAAVWVRAGAPLYRHGENFYNFQGIRLDQEKFDAVCEPRYLASPGRLPLLRILTNVTTRASVGLGGGVAR